MNNKDINCYLKEQKIKIKKHDFLKKYIINNIIIISLILIFTNVIFGIVIVTGNSMYPTIHDKDIVIYNRFIKNYDNEDIIIIRNLKTNEYCIKRLIASAGDYINIDSDKRRVIKNNVMIEENYLTGYSTDKHDIELPIIVPPGNVFVLGDNREVSKDSRSTELGMVQSENILGRMICLIRINR